MVVLSPSLLSLPTLPFFRFYLFLSISPFTFWLCFFSTCFFFFFLGFSLRHEPGSNGSGMPSHRCSNYSTKFLQKTTLCCSVASKPTFPNVLWRRDLLLLALSSSLSTHFPSSGTCLYLRCLFASSIYSVLISFLNY